MKRILTLSAALLSSILLGATPVSMQQARRIAALRLDAPESSLSAVLDSRASISLSSVSDAPYYVFNNRGGGFAIISGDDCITPIIGYSLSGKVDAARIPANMKYWLGMLSTSVRLMRESGAEPSEAVVREWESPVRPATRAGGGKLLEIPTWSQEHPYNWYCPIISPYEKGHSLTGCVATAISMIMRYHMWPPCGSGTIPAYHMYYEGDKYAGYYYMPGHELGHEYRWADMPMADIYDSDTSHAPTDAEKQVAWLMYDCGVMMEAMYSEEGTGAYSQYIPGRLNKFMHYNKASYVARDSYSGDWVALIEDQIDKGLPVIYGADDSQNGGHQFVVCGYDDSDKLYVNWGWGGDCNGYYAIDAFKPSGSGMSFTGSHDAIINLEPDRSVVPVPVEMDEPMAVMPSKSDGPQEPDVDIPGVLYLQAGEYSGTYYSGVELSDGTISRGASFSMNAGVLNNPTKNKYTGYFRFDQYTYDGRFIGTLGYYKSKGKVASLYVNAGAQYRIIGLACTASFDYGLGDRIVLCTSTTNNSGSVWTPVPWVDDGYTQGELPMISMGFIDPVSKKSIINSSDTWIEMSIEESAGAVRAEIEMEDGSTEVILLEN